MNALRRSIVLLFVLLAATSVAVTAGAVQPSTTTAEIHSGVSFQQNTTNTSANTTNTPTNTTNTPTNATTTSANATNTSANTTNASANATNTSANASIVVENQTRNGESVFIDSATLPDGGFVVLSEPGPNGSVVGVSLPLAPGSHEGKITLRGVSGADLNRTSLGANTTLVATLYRDSNGNDRFDGLLASGTDEPYTENGTPVGDRARITIPEAEQPTTAAVNLTNQTSRGTNLTVDSVTLSEGGYVGVHQGGYNGSNATESMIGATDYLEPGTYENVTVRVGNVSGRNATLTDSGRVSAVVYTDTDGDREFQYVSSGGVEDQPSLANGTPVAESASLTVERPETPTQTATPTPTATNTPTPTATAEPQTAAARDRATPYGAGSDGREGILENPLFPLLVLVFAIFAVLAVVGR